MKFSRIDNNNRPYQDDNEDCEEASQQLVVATPEYFRGPEQRSGIT